MGELIRTEHLCVNFSGLKALDDINLTIQDDEIFGIIGPNGAGKTTFFNAITGFTKPTSGEVYFCGDNMTKKNTTSYCEKGIARTFQNIRVFGQMTALENVLVGMHKTLHANLLDIFLHNKRQREEEKRAIEKAEEILEFLGIADIRNDLSTSLPYGTQRKVEVARALASDPKMILLDEPTAGMNPQETDDLMHLIAMIRKRGPAVTVIEHNIGFMLNLCDRIAVLNFGKLLDLDEPQKVAKNPEVIAAYIGEEG